MGRKEFSRSSAIIFFFLMAFSISSSSSALGDDGESKLAGSCMMCSREDIDITQGSEGGPGIPTYTVTIINSCLAQCRPRNIHLSCGWFSSREWVDPQYFRRISYDDCLVNYGRPMKPYESIYFTYSNTFMFPLRVKSVDFV